MTAHASLVVGLEVLGIACGFLLSGLFVTLSAVTSDKNERALLMLAAAVFVVTTLALVVMVDT